MLELIKSRMKETDYTEFISDYNTLIELKKNNRKLHKYCMAIKRSGKQPFAKPYFDIMKNKYYYNCYKEMFLDNYTVKEICKRSRKAANAEFTAKQIEETLKLHFSIETYIGFLIEHLIFEEINNGKNEIQISTELDTIYKTDIMINKCCYQIKNYSFLQTNEKLDKIISEYKAVNKDLLFIFYTTEKENIYFAAIGGLPLRSVNDINGFTFTIPIALIGIKELCKEIETRKGKIHNVSV